MARTCSSCNSPNPIPDDAKFCPSCGAKVEAEAPATAIMATVVDSTATSIDAPRVLAGRFVVSGDAVETPLGTELPATDSKGGGAVRVTLVSQAVIPSSALAERALREWKQLSKVTTPKIVRVIDQGKLEDGKVYVASEVPAGKTLEDVVSTQGPMPIERVKTIVSQVGEALTEAQKVGVIHRDVSPRNIHVDGDKVTVGEFGLAEAVTDNVFGTPAFLSPEQAEGKPVDQRSNIYSLGAVIYYMLTGRPPFEGTPESLLAQHLSGTPPHPSAKRPSVPPELDRIVMKALEKSGGRRHLTLRQLISEVEAVSATGGVVRSEELGSAATLPPQGAARPPAATMIGVAVSMPKPPDEKPTISKATPAVPPSGPATIPQKAPAIDSAKTMLAPAPVAPAPVTPAPVAKEVAAPAKPEPAKTEATPPVEPSKPPEPKPAPLPVQATPVVPLDAPKAAVAAKDPPRAAGKKPGGFRETAWFKKGEIEEELAKQQASASEDPLAPTGTTGKHAALDSGSLSVMDERRLSLKTGATSMMPAIKISPSGAAQILPGERMNEEEMLAEIDQGRRWLKIAGVITAAAVVAAILAFGLRGKEPEAPAKSEATTPAPAPSAPTPTTPAPTAAAPTALPPPSQPATPPAAAPTPVAPAPVAAAPAAPSHASKPAKHKKHR